MTTITMPVLSAPRGRIFRFPTREETRAMMMRPSVAVTVVICATWFATVAIGAVVWLAYTGHDTAVIGALIGGPLLTILGVLASRLRAVHEAVKTVQTQTSTDQ